MSLSCPDRRRDLPVRLCDLDPHVLAKAAREAAKHETDPAKIDEILWAATMPSNRTYYVDHAAEPLLRAIAA